MYCTVLHRHMEQNIFFLLDEPDLSNVTTDPAPAPALVLEVSTPSFHPRINSTVARKRQRSESEEIEARMSEVFGPDSPPSVATLTELSDPSLASIPTTISEVSNPSLASLPTTLSEGSVMVTPQSADDLVTSKPAARSDVSDTVSVT